MPNLFKEPDYDAVQLLYGFVLLATAILLGTTLVGNMYAITAVLCLLLIKDGFPNFIVGVMKVSKGEKKNG